MDTNSTLFGVNACYLRGDYGHDLAPNPRFPDWPCSFEALHAYRVLIEAQRMGFGAVRMWLCENAEGILIDDAGNVVGVHDQLIESLKIIQEAAHLHGLKLYPTLLDGNSWPREKDDVTRAILEDADQTARFADKVVGPIVAALDPELIVAVEIINEPETCAAACMADSDLPSIEWSTIGRAIRTCGDAVRAQHDHWVSAGTMHEFLPDLWRSEPKLSAVDVHVYHPNGGLPSRDELADYVGDEAIRDPSLPLFGGELGLPDDAESPSALCHYIHNADRLDYTAAFLWQLEGDLYDKTRPRRPETVLGEEVRTTLSQRAIS